MPRIDRNNQITTITREGEITIHLNLNINLESGDINVSSIPNSQLEDDSQDSVENETPDFIPEEMFKGGKIPSVKGFGKKAE